jgi:hypothetical protein
MDYIVKHMRIKAKEGEKVNLPEGIILLEVEDANEYLNEKYSPEWFKDHSIERCYKIIYLSPKK